MFIKNRLRRVIKGEMILTENDFVIPVEFSDYVV